MGEMIPDDHTILFVLWMSVINNLNNGRINIMRVYISQF